MSNEKSFSDDCNSFSFNVQKSSSLVMGINDPKIIRPITHSQPSAYKRSQLTTKRIIWGKEIPHVVHHHSSNTNNIQIFDNYIMILGSNPLITIRPINIRDEVSTSSTSSYDDPHTNRVFELDNLRNYFQLNEPESSSFHHGQSTISTIRFRYEYFLSLLDPTMPRLTNCGNYYRMRYAVYVAIKNSDSMSNDFNVAANDWRNMQASLPSTKLLPCKRKLVHIGEIHLYTIVPESTLSSGKLYNSMDQSKLPPYIHYENISFFSSQIPLSREELQVLQLSNNSSGTSDFTTIVNHFRGYLKYLNTIVVVDEHRMNAKPNRSTCLLEQLKYPKNLDQFSNPDRIFHQFNRTQCTMLAKYLHSCTQPVTYSNVEQQLQLQQPNEKTNESDIITSDLFVHNLVQLMQSTL